MTAIREYLNKHFTWVIAFVVLFLFTLNLWLFWPGYLHLDWVCVMGDLPLNNWQPVIYPWVIKKITYLFGYHIWYPLLFNLVPFYLGIFILVLGLWKKFHSKWCWLGLLPILIGNIFLHNIVAHCSFSSPMFIFMLWCAVLYQLLVGITYKNSIFVLISFISAVISRHNALIQVYPIFFIYAWVIVQKLNMRTIWHKTCTYIAIAMSFAILTIVVAKGIPNLLTEHKIYPSNHIFLHQIAGACVPNNDESCFKPEWYEEGRSFADVKNAYKKNPVNADLMTFAYNPEHPFKSGKLDGLFNMWIKAIMKYPYNWLTCINQFRMGMWHTKPLQQKVFLTENTRFLSQICADSLLPKYPDNELYYTTPTTKTYIYGFLNKILPEIPTFTFILINYILFVIAGVLFIKRRNLLLLYTLSSCIAGIAASIIFCLFTPIIFPRYIYPILINSLVATIGIIISLFASVRDVPLIRRPINIKHFAQKHRIYFGIVIVLLILFGTYRYFYGPVMARVDVHSSYTENPKVLVIKNDKVVPEAVWMPDNGSRGVVIQQFGKSVKFTVIALDDTNITFSLLGPDVRNAQNQHIKKWVKYTSFNVNGKSLLPKSTNAWHNRPFTYTMPVKKHTVYPVEITWHKK